MAFLLRGSDHKLLTTNKTPAECFSFGLGTLCAICLCREALETFTQLQPPDRGWDERGGTTGGERPDPCTSVNSLIQQQRGLLVVLLASACVRQPQKKPVPILHCKAESKDDQGHSEHPASQATAGLRHGSTRSPDPPSLSPLPKPQGY